MQILKRLLRRVILASPLRTWLFSYQAKLTQWTCPVADSTVSILIPKNELDAYDSDERKGQLTGIDKSGSYEYEFASKFVNLLQPDSVLFDVGASRGFYSVLAYQSMKPTRQNQIVCFEPHPYSLYVLESNNKRYCNSYLRICNRSVSNLDDRHSVSVDSYSTRQCILPTVVKMDIEGFEFFAVQGMENICNRSRPTILMEYHYRIMRDKLGVDPEEVIHTLEKWNYRLRFNGHHWYTSQNRGDVDADWHDSPPSAVNFALWAEAIG